MRYEKDMKKGIIKFLYDNRNCNYIADEINSGYGIVDFVGVVRDLNTKTFYFKNLTDVFLLQTMTVDYPTHIDDIEKNTFYSRNYLKNVVLKRYISQGILINVEKNIYTRTREFDADKIILIAIEAKLAKWKEAVKQAMDYKKFADYSFVALYKKNIKNVNLQLFKNNNIGLISVDNNLEFNILKKPKVNHELYLEAKLFVSGLTTKTTNDI